MQTEMFCHYADDIFNLISLYENCCILRADSLKHVPMDPDNDKPFHDNGRNGRQSTVSVH